VTQLYRIEELFTNGLYRIEELFTNGLYRIEELFTNGWELIDESAVQLTKEQCDQLLQDYLERGYNPNRLRAVYDS
jgi:hypothetical protein